MVKINSSEITPERIYVSRRKFLVGMGALAASFLFLSSCGGRRGSLPGPIGPDFCESAQASRNIDELGDELTDCESVINFDCRSNWNQCKYIFREY